MRRGEPLVFGLAAVLAGAACLLPLPTALRSIAALALVAYLPGYCLVLALGRRRPLSGAARHVGAVALSLAVTVIVGLGLNVAQVLDRTGWAIALPLIALAASSVASTTARPVAAWSWDMPTPAPRLRAAACGVALLAVCGAVALARYGAQTQAQYAYTDLWMVPDGAPHASSAEVGVRNNEGVPTRYQIEIVSRGTLSDQTAPFLLAPGEERVLRVPLPNVVFAPEPPKKEQDADPEQDALEAAEKLRIQRLGDPSLRVEARLYKNGDRNVAYRKVWAVVPKQLGLKKTIPVQQLDDAVDLDLARASEDVTGEARVFARIDAHVIETKAKPREP